MSLKLKFVLSITEKIFYIYELLNRHSAKLIELNNPKNLKFYRRYARKDFRKDSMLNGMP